MKFTKNALTAVLLSTFALPGASFAAHPATLSEFVTSSKQQMQKNHPQQSPAASATQRQKPMSANHPPASYADIVEIEQAKMQKNFPAVTGDAMQQRAMKPQPKNNMPTTWGQAIEQEKMMMDRQ